MKWGGYFIGRKNEVRMDFLPGTEVLKPRFWPF
jgi:hypothetical protein